MVLFLLSLGAGFLTVLAPCVLPLLPVIVGGSARGERTLTRAFVVTASLAVSVILCTLLIKASTLFISIPPDFWKWFSGSIIIIFGLITLFPTLWESLPFLGKATVGSNKLMGRGYKRHDVWGDIIVGAALGPVFSTCSPTYFLVLATVLPAHFFVGLVYLAAYTLGLSIALLSIAFIGQKVLDTAGAAADPHSTFKKVLGCIFVVVGIMIITGADKKLQTRILDAGFFDVTKVEEELLRFAPQEKPVPQAVEAPKALANNDAKVPIQESTPVLPPAVSPSNTAPKVFTETPSPVVKSSPAPKTILEKVKEILPASVPDTRVRAPEISTPDGFINTDGKPITLASLRGKVVLLTVWTYTCINCQRTLPHINDLYAKYKDQGFVVVGLHTPEFSFERVQKNVEKAVQDEGIQYPVVLDNDYSTWNAYGNRYWPRRYLIDKEGYIVYDHIGEGGYEETDEAVRVALLK